MDDKGLAFLVRSRNQARAGEQVLQRLQRRERSIQAIRAYTVDGVGVHDHAFAGLLGKHLQGGLRVLRGNIESAFCPSLLSHRSLAMQSCDCAERDLQTKSLPQTRKIEVL